MLTIRFALVALLTVFGEVQAVPQTRGRKGGNRNGGGNAAAQQTPQQQAAAIPQGISQATDGSMILDMTATVNNLDLRFKISAPADQFTTASGVPGAAAQPGAQGPNGINVLLHGDGGQSFFDFPNQAVQQGPDGSRCSRSLWYVLLASLQITLPRLTVPSEQLLWGQSQGQPQGLSRADGAAHSQAVNDLMQQVLPQMVAFNSSNVFMTGVSGGSLTLSGFFVPAHMANFAGTGVLLMCGALAPQVDFNNSAAVASTTKIHFQSTQQELTSLQAAIPEAITAYEQLATGAGLNAQQVGALQTVDNTPNGGHCEFDEQGFSSGIQLVSNNFASIMQGGNGAVQGINTQTVLTPVVGNENVQFAATGNNKRQQGPYWIGV
ncbi:hypothetical protein INS49_001327 [Diaporthe citri]|uniref:uncharacterized protein n=1 Tax=Diaporthe citri TaxID=83186 RepID=UPI001C7F30FD|nr:uncharacterized protein INS49_001327 [Diaporthe citri]KAG6367144.1 hypothetical protein INS49_001327 [Diaporthe citri]